MRPTALLLAALLASACDAAALDQTDFSGGVAGGIEQTVLVESPHGSCTGVLVSPRCVVTAAHCEGPESGPMTDGIDHMGASRIHSAHLTNPYHSVFVAAASTVVHPSWPNPDYLHKPVFDAFDLAILGLDEPATGLADPGVDLATAPPADGTWLVGNGRTLDGTVEPEAITANVLVTSHDDHYLVSSDLDAHGAVTSHPQPGDSGGPLFVAAPGARPELYGLTSWGFFATVSGFTRVDSPEVQAWITSQCAAFENAPRGNGCGQFDGDQAGCQATGVCTLWACDGKCRPSGLDGATEQICCDKPDQFPWCKPATGGGTPPSSGGGCDWWDDNC